MIDSKNTTIYFIRHGDVDNPKQIVYGQTIDVHLSPLGFIQIQNLAKKIQEKGITPSAIYTSPLTRTVQSTTELSKVFPETPVIKRDELMDIAGSLTGKTLEWFNSLKGREYDQPGVESPQAIEQRVLKVVKDAIEKYMGQTVFIVSSADPIAFVLWRLRNHEGELPQISELNKTVYLKKGEAWRVVLTAKLDVIEDEMIIRDDDKTPGKADR